MKSMIGFAGMSVIAIYLASLAEHAGEVVATEQMLWILGAAILAGSVGILLFDP